MYTNLNVTTRQTSTLWNGFFPAFNSAAEGSIKSSREQERGPGISQPYSLIFGKALEQ